jgi:hypothetical protein
MRTDLKYTGLNYSPVRSLRELERTSRVSCSIASIQRRKRKNSQRWDQKNPQMSPAVIVSAFMPEYVSTRQRKYGLRQGASG